LGHVIGLEDVEEGLFDVFFEIESSFDVLFGPCIFAAKEKRKGIHMQVLFNKMRKIFRRGACKQLRIVWFLSWRLLYHHTPSPQEQHSPHHDPSSPSHPTTTSEPIPKTPTETPTKTPTLRQYSRRATQIAQSKALFPTTDEPASLLRNDSQREAFHTVSSLDAGHDRENINKISTLPHESSPRVTSLDTDEGRGSMEIGEEVGVERSTELGSNDTEEMVNVLSSMEAANILISEVAAVSVSPVAGVSIVGVPTVSGLFPTVSAIFSTASVVTPYSRRPREISEKDKGKEKVVESKVPKKRKLQEQIDAQVAREMEEEFTRENQRLSEQLARDSEIARLHAEEDLKMMIEGLDRSNELIAKHLQEYEQAAADLSSKPLLKKEQREFYMSVLKSHAGWKTKHFRGMTLEEIKEKFIPVWKQLEDFVPMSSKEEDLKGIMQLVPLEEVYVKALQRRFTSAVDLGERNPKYQTGYKRQREKLWVELKRLFEPDFEDQLWTHNQAFIHNPLEWKLYDTCGVHHVFTKDQEIFMLVEKDYPLRKGLATVMICNKLQYRLCTRIVKTILRLFGYFSVLFHFIVIPLDHQRVTITLLSKVVDPTLGNNNNEKMKTNTLSMCREGSIYTPREYSRRVGVD
nr:hypothetical protein [Tanacetum cinerariifolium]